MDEHGSIGVDVNVLLAAGQNVFFDAEKRWIDAKLICRARVRGEYAVVELVEIVSGWTRGAQLDDGVKQRYLRGFLDNALRNESVGLEKSD